MILHCGVEQPGSSARKMKICYANFHHEPSRNRRRRFYGTSGSKNMFFVYILLSEIDNRFYVGLTEDVAKRLDAHNSGKVPSTKHRKPLRLVYYEAYIDKRDAQGREKYLKSGSGHRFLKKQLKYYFNSIYCGVEQPGSSSGSVTKGLFSRKRLNDNLSNSVKPEMVIPSQAQNHVGSWEGVETRRQAS
jgi:putative endonuclease